ncbi:hypothetical protein FACS1894174_00840 [Bacteroidia bacterium]|nr:hypothetical protein FACS1894174_00840 [Bacteroidia bacterium]
MRKIGAFFTIRNIVLTLLTGASFYIIGCVGLSALPTIGSISNAENLNKVLLNTSYSYLAGLIFYFLVTYMPYRQRAKKIKPAISGKINIIYGKMRDSVRCLKLLTDELPTTITETYLIQLLSGKSVFDKSGYSITGLDITIIQHLRLQRDEIKNIIKELLEYKEYLTDDQLCLIEEIREAQYFYLLNAFNFGTITDNQQIRESLAKEMYKQICNVEQLKLTT